MTKTELIEALANKQSFLKKNDIDLAIDCIFEYMSEALEANQRIEIRGFGVFSLRYLAPRRGRNPFSGEVLDLPATYSVHFKPGKELKQRVAESRTSVALRNGNHDSSRFPTYYSGEINSSVNSKTN